jgi:hypothetical protein
VPVSLPNGDVAVLGTYFENGSLGKNSRHLWVTRSMDGGATFSAPALVMDRRGRTFLLEGKTDPTCSSRLRVTSD